MRSRRYMTWFGWICVVVVIGCSDTHVSPDERLEHILASDSLLRDDPDMVNRTEAAIDSLFLAYGADEFQFEAPDSQSVARWVDSVASSLSIEEKIGQHFIIHLDPKQYAGLVDNAAAAVRELHVGGFLVPRLLEPREVFEATQRLQRIARVPLFFAADYERGVGRFNNTLTELPSNMAIGATRDTVFAAAAGRLTALEARSIGVNLLFAPVVDVNNNPDNPIINIRSFGEDPDLVGRMGAAFVHEAQGRGLLTTLKHFPGHGDTAVDSHSRMGTVRGDSLSLEQVELGPYRYILGRPSQPAAVMSAHLWIEALEPDPLPATFSSQILGDLLRRDMAFEGIVITDDIRMGALQQDYNNTERMLRPLLAGANIILTPANVSNAVEIVRSAVESGRLSRERLDASVRRILRTKAEAGLHQNRFAPEERLNKLLDEPFGSYIAQAIADRSITLLKTHSSLPLRADTQRIETIHMTNYRSSESIEAAMDLFDKALAETAKSKRFDEEPSGRQITDAVTKAGEADVIVLALYLRLQAGRGEAGLFPMQTELVERLLALEKPLVLVTFGNPYAASTFQESDGVVVAYDQSLPTIVAAVRVLQGLQRAPGRLPITIEPFAYGSGMDWVAETSAAPGAN